MTSFSQIKLFLDIRGRFLQERLQTGTAVVEIDASAVFPMLYLRKFQK